MMTRSVRVPQPPVILAGMIFLRKIVPALLPARVVVKIAAALARIVIAHPVVPVHLAPLIVPRIFTTEWAKSQLRRRYAKMGTSATRTNGNMAMVNANITSTTVSVLMSADHAVPSNMQRKNTNITITMRQKRANTTRNTDVTNARSILPQSAMIVPADAPRKVTRRRNTTIMTMVMDMTRNTTKQTVSTMETNTTRSAISTTMLRKGIIKKKGRK